MTIKNSEECTFRPIIAFFTRRFHYIQNYWHSILIVISNYSLICICWITTNYPVFSHWALCLLKVRKLNCIRIWIRSISKKQSIYIHNISWLRTNWILLWIQHYWSLRKYCSLGTSKRGIHLTTKNRWSRRVIDWNFAWKTLDFIVR